MGRSSLRRRLDAQRAARRSNPARTPLKINLYTAAETRAAALAARRLAAEGAPPGIECLMVGDSYLMTHLGRPTTRIEEPGEQRWALGLMVGLLGEVRQALDRAAWPGEPPWLMGDFPDGAATALGTALPAAARMAEAGAEAVKVEISDAGSWAVLEGLGERGWGTIAHLGYAPQHGANRRYGGDLGEAAALFAAARRARDCGALALVLERVDPLVHGRLAAPHPAGLPVYAIFSGIAPGGAQNLNVWDAVVRPDTPRAAFPPSAVLARGEVEALYREELIAERLAALIRLVEAGAYPPQRTLLDPSRREELASMPVWEA